MEKNESNNEKKKGSNDEKKGSNDDKKESNDDKKMSLFARFFLSFGPIFSTKMSFWGFDGVLMEKKGQMIKKWGKRKK